MIYSLNTLALSRATFLPLSGYIQIIHSQMMELQDIFFFGVDWLWVFFWTRMANFRDIMGYTVFSTHYITRLRYFAVAIPLCNCTMIIGMCDMLDERSFGDIGFCANRNLRKSLAFSDIMFGTYLLYVSCDHIWRGKDGYRIFLLWMKGGERLCKGGSI